MKQKYGELINVKAANDYLSQYETVRKSIASVVSNHKPNSGAAAQTNLKKAKAYATARVNAFIFRRDVIDQLFAMKDSKGKKPQYFMIHFAAKANSTPTMVILGCNKAGSKFKSMMHLTPCGETPGTTWVPALKMTESGDEIIFTPA